MIIRPLLVLLGIVFCHILKAQDPFYSQIFSNRLYTNPAFTGANPGLRVAMIHRQLWPNVPGPFHTTGFGLDLNTPGLSGGIGLTAMNDNRGEGFLNTNQFGLLYNWRRPVDYRRNMELSFGMEVCFVSKSIDWSKFEFSDQFDPVLGKIYNSSAQQPANISIFYPDFNAGFSVNQKFGRGRNSNLYLGYGGAIHHTFRPSESFIGVNRRVPVKASLYAGAMMIVRDIRSKAPTMFFPHIYYAKQGGRFKPFYDDSVKFRTFQAGVYLFKDWYFTGIDYRNSPTSPARNTDALVILLGATAGAGSAGSLQVIYSYDINVGGLRSQTWGSHELSIVFTFDEFRLGGNRGRKKPLNCFDFPHRGVFKLF